jgi:hypothetical protein
VALGFPFNAGDSLAQFQPLNVVEILKFGLSGLVFLFALLSFWLFYAEQKRDPPRPKMLGCILMFSLLNLVAASLVAVTGRFGVAAAPNALASGYALPTRLDSTGFAYSCDYSTFFIDMSGWKKLPAGVDKRTRKISSATFTRNDLLRKLSSSTEDYVLRPWTTGAGIDTGFLRAPSGVELSFNEVSSDSERSIVANLNQLYDLERFSRRDSGGLASRHRGTHKIRVVHHPLSRRKGSHGSQGLHRRRTQPAIFAFQRKSSRPKPGSKRTELRHLDRQRHTRQALRVIRMEVAAEERSTLAEVSNQSRAPGLKNGFCAVNSELVYDEATRV